MIIPLYCPQRKNEINRNLFDKTAELDWVQVVGKPPAGLFLIVDEGKLGIANQDYPKVHPVFVDFLHGASSHRRLHGGGAGQAVAKAVGLNRKRELHILDATAGLGRDSFVMASLGASVTLFERNPVVFEVLNDGLSRMQLSGDEEIHDIYQRMKLSKHSLLSLSPEQTLITPDVIYLDPMFPERGKSAKVKKDMLMFHDLVGADEDANGLLAPALELAQFRVVVKRSKNAPDLAEKKPTTSMVGKSSRFDIYSKKAIS